MTMSDEIELKLGLTPQDAVVLINSGLLGAGSTKARQRSIYFDTFDHCMVKAGLSLRIRHSGRKRIQTVKARGASSSGLFSRPEWERAVPDNSPIIDETTPIQALLGERILRLAPVFEVYVQRRAWDVREGDAIIEVVLDRGEVVAGDRRSSICEVELELKHGYADALFALARKIDAVVPVRLGVMTKAERGYALLEPAAKAFKAEPIVINHDATAVQALREIVQACLHQFRRNEDLLLAGPVPDALHQARVALRRLRSAFSIFEKLIDDDVSAGLRDDLRWLAAELGQARNLDVILERAPYGELRDRLNSARQVAYIKVDDALASLRIRRLMLDLADWNANGAWLEAANTRNICDQPARKFASTALDRLRQKLKKHGRDLTEADDKARHRVRKDAKQLRYAAEFFVALLDHKSERRRHAHFIETLEMLQEKFGSLSDLAMAHDLMTKFGCSGKFGAADWLFPRSKKSLRNDAENAYTALSNVKRFWR